MKKFLPFLLIAFLACAMQLSAQTDFKFSATSYVGALSADAAYDWTKGWTNWDPKNANYPDPTDLTTLNGMDAYLAVPGEKKISGTLTLDASKTYLLTGFIVVPDGAKLVIPAGTVIRAKADLSTTPKNYAMIVVERGGKIEVLGTAASPVVFTSANAIGQRDRGNWGGLLIAGKARHNLLNGTDNNNVQMEGFPNVSFDNTLARFGGTNPNDNSGIVRYLRIEFGGIAFEINKEINGLTLGGVGNATELHHVQVSYSGDDSFEWFGGTVNSSHLIAFKGTDDDFDTDNGYSGLSQFGIGIRDSAYYDLTYNISGGSVSEGFESDTEATGTAAVTPKTTAIFSNYTMIGPVPVGSSWANMNSTTKAAFRRGARLRRNTAERIVNSIFMGYRNTLMIDGDSTLRNTNFAAALALVMPANTPVDADSHQTHFENNLIVNSTCQFNTAGDTTANGLVEVTKAAKSALKLAAVDAWVRQSGPLANNIDPVGCTAGAVLVNPLAASTTPDFRPVAGSPALAGANFFGNPLLVNLSLGANEIPVALASPIYPNPITDGTLHFGREVISYGIFDFNGRLVRHGVDTDHAEISGLPKGIYFIKLDGVAQKLIVQ
jgi:hypothetical protein